MQTLVTRMRALFNGHDGAYGTYATGDKVGDKVGGTAETRMDPVTDQLWEKHLSGESGLGIVPLREDNTCTFGAIDIDVYRGMDTEAFVKKVYKELPLIPIRSKSGGLHLYLFLSAPVPAKLLRKKLSLMAKYLNQSEAEIFPKQDTALWDQGDMASWINMPYFDAENTERYAHTPDNKPMSLEGFLLYAETHRRSSAELKSFNVPIMCNFTDGPPCLETGCKHMFSEGNRHEGLYQMGVYLRKSFKSEWQAMLDDHNQAYCSPPKDARDVAKMIRSLSHKDYQYQCNGALKDWCDKEKCMRRKYGVGNYDAPELSNLAKYSSNPPMWFVNVGDKGRVELTTEELQQPIKFQKRCMEALNYMPSRLTTKLWDPLVSKLMAEVEIIKAPREASVEGMLEHYLEKFVTGPNQGTAWPDILLGSTIRNEGKHWFRMADFLQFLNARRYNAIKTPSELANSLRKLGGETAQKKIRGKTCRVWCVEEFDVPDLDDIDVGNDGGF